MKRLFLVLGILLEIIFLSFYIVKYLMVSWGVEKLFLDDSRTFTLTFILLGLGLLIQIISGIIVYRYKISFKYVLVFSIIFNLSLLFVWNIASNDLYTHIQRGRMVAKYNANPYSVVYDDFKLDKFYEETRTVWSGQLSIYGPTFTLFNALISYFCQDNLLAHIIVYKLIYSMLNILVGYFIYKITKSVYASFLYLWNPAVIFEIQLNNHLEALMIFPMVFALYLLLFKANWKWYVFALSVLTIGSLTKFFSFIVYPFYILYVVKKLKRIKERLLFLVVGGFLQLLIVGLSFLPFADRAGFMDGLFDLAKGTFISPSLTMLILMYVFELVKVGKEMAMLVSQSIFKIIYLFLIVKSILMKNFIDEKVFIMTLLLSFVGFIFIYLNLLLPWYVLSLIVFLSLYYGVSREKKYIFFVHIVTIYSFLLYVRLI